MNRLYASGLLVVLLAVSMGTFAVVRAATTLDSCGLPLVPWLGSGEAPSDPDVVAECPAQTSDRKREVVGEAAASTVLLTAGITMVVQGRRKDRQEQSALPPDPFAPNASVQR